MQLPGVPVYGEPLMSLLHTPTHTPTQIALGHEIIHMQTHMHTARACPPRSQCIQWLTVMQTQKIHYETSQGNQADRSKSTHTGMNLFRTFENRPKDVFLKTNYPRGSVKEWPLLVPVHIRIQQIIVGIFFFPGLVGATHSALDIESSFTKERQKYICIVFRLSEAVSNYMTTRCARCELQFRGPCSVIFSLMTMCFWVYLIGW